MAEVELEVMHKGAKALSTPRLDPKLSQQKRRDLLLEWQKCRRDEIVEKLRSLDESGASESEGEDVDFLEEVKCKYDAIKQRIDSTDGTKTNNGESLKQRSSNGEVEWRNVGRGRSVRTESAEKMDFNRDGRGRGRGIGQVAQRSADADTNWWSKEIEITKTPSGNGSVPPKYQRRQKRPTPYGIMLSEWLTDVPEDFEENWTGILCPVGRRCIVMACRGKTKVFTRRNDYLGQFASCLPGGSKALHYSVSGNRRRGVTILDCLWSDKSQMFYVLDLICWNSHSVNNCPTDFRHFFLISKFQETPELGETTPNNAVPFMPLPMFPLDNLGTTMNTIYPVFPDEIDGVLFYHKNVFYIPEVTPLVLWVHLSDMGTVLSVDVNPDLLARERVQDPRKRYYLDKPKYEKKVSKEVEVEVEIFEPCDVNGVPLG